MKVLHTIPSLGVNSGGPATAVNAVADGLRLAGVDAEILAMEAGSGDQSIAAGDHIHLLPYVANAFDYNPAFAHYLKEHPVYDLYHAHSVWLYPPHATAAAARRLRKPYVITPRGMLYPQDMAQGRLKKLFAMRLFLRRDLQRAACIQATCLQEMEYLRALGLTAPVAVIPNPVDVRGAELPVVSHEVRRVGYMGRVHPRKRIERLIYAFHELGPRADGCELVIIGGGDREYMNFLQAEKERLHVKNITFTGFLTGAEKERALESLSYLALPSDFENFGNVIAEAMVLGIPVICTRGAPWRQVEAADCGWWVDNDTASLRAAIGAALATPEARRIEMGMRCKRLMEECYAPQVVAQMMKRLYEWILNKNARPDFIYEL